MPYPDFDRLIAGQPFEQWDGRGRGYLNTASYGLPPRCAIRATKRLVEEWSAGSAGLADWLPPTEAARETFGRLIGVDHRQIATGTSVSQLVALLAGSLRPGTHVIAPDDEFTSLLYPFLVEEDRGVRVELVPREALGDVVSERGDVVLFSLVSSVTGELAQWRTIADAAGSRGALTVVDGAQACGWLTCEYDRFDALVCPAFKWLCSPRGTAFLRVSDRLLDQVRPSAAGWWASVDGRRFHGGPLELAPDARRLDVSPTWTSWPGTTAALSTIEDIGVQVLAAHAITLANHLRNALGHPPGETPIVVAGGENAAERLAAGGLVASPTATGARLAFHANNNDDDVERASEALTSAR